MERDMLTNENFFLKKFFEISIVTEVKDINNDIIVVENAGNILNVRMLYAYELNKLQVGDSIELYIMLKDTTFRECNDGIEVNLVGFISKDIRCFCELLECPGVGIRGSAGVFEYIRTTGMDIDFICKEIESGNIRFFTQFPGFGEKISERLCRFLNVNEFRRLGNLIFINLDKTRDVQDNNSKAMEQVGEIEALNKTIELKGERDRYCYNCGSKLVDEGSFCTKCGCKVINPNDAICEDKNYEAEKKTEVQEIYVTAMKRREMKKYIQNNFSSSEKAAAIKYVIKETGWGLKKGKEFVDSIEFVERLRADSMETVHYYEYDDFYEPEQYNSNRGGFFSSLIHESTENSNKRNSGKRAKPDLIGSHGCIKGKKDGNFTQSCNFSCPLWHDCSRGSSY